MCSSSDTYVSGPNLEKMYITTPPPPPIPTKQHELALGDLALGLLQAWAAGTYFTEQT